MGKNGKKQRHQHKPNRQRSYYLSQEDDDDYNEHYQESSPSSALNSQNQNPLNGEEEEEEENLDNQNPLNDSPSKFVLYQQSVQSPKGDISYLQKFFLMYVGGRVPLHLQEDFCGTALLSLEWLRGDSRRTVVGVDLDIEALNWCLKNNMGKGGADVYSRISLFHGNVLQPLEAKLVQPSEALIGSITLEDGSNGSEASLFRLDGKMSPDICSADEQLKKNIVLPARDIVCAFNYSCCCLHTRRELITYFRHVLDVLSKKGGIFVMDVYGGLSSEKELTLKRRFPNFTYVWEQAEFDLIQRKTRISLHFHLHKPQRKIRHAFSYSWRLWSLPEIKDCLEEAGFQSVHFWIRQMPDTDETRSTEGLGTGRDVKYEEVTTFHQQDAWNAYIIGVANLNR
ncbi:hypothetical protein RJ641_033226 [Dillenia turbinata]|uniref:Uncharacterized protein n=1 Tax=Dillenia turbinata TaxID=194707 RepID=A0AAN8ZFJ2_9MAGN